MKSEQVLRRRLATQRLTSAGLPRAADVVRLLTCVQSQERDHAFFSLGLRTRKPTYSSVQSEFDQGAFVRTHILRPTWHFVAPEDLRWILELTAPRVVQSMGARHRQLGLDDARLVNASMDAVTELLSGGSFLTRKEIGERLARRNGVVQAGEQLGHLLLLAEMQGLICSGPMKGVHHSYAIVDEVIPPTPAMDRDAAVIELARRFFGGHGPASIKDFTRWSSLTITDTKAALIHLDEVLVQVEVDGTTLWFDPSLPARTTRTPPAILFPTYDEAVLTYPTLSFPAVDDHPRDNHQDPFWSAIVIGTTNVGLWRRTVQRDQVEIETRLASSLGDEERERVRAATQRMAEFLERDLVYVNRNHTASTGAPT